MSGIVSKILGTGNVVEKGLSLIDSMYTSKEEEIRSKSKAKTDLLAAYAPFKLAQRVLAIMFASVFLVCFILSLGFVLHAYATGNLGSVNDVNIVNAIRDLMTAFKIPWIMGTIILFYFGGGFVEGYQDKKASREVEREKARRDPPGPR